MRRVPGRCLLALASSVVLASSCLSPQAIRQDVRRSRDAAFEAWRRARAAEDSSRPTVRGDLSLAAAQVLAMGNNKQLQAAVEGKEVARGRITEAWSQALPRLDLSASYRRLDQVPSIDLSGGGSALGATAAPQQAGGAAAGGAAAAPAADTTGAGAAKSITMGDQDNYSLALTLRQPIFRGGAIGAGIRAARVYAILADEEVRGAVHQVLFEARKRYYDVLLARELVEVSEDDLQRVRRHLEDVRKKRAGDVATEFDVLRARVEVSNVEAELIERQNALRLAKAAVLRTLGVSQDSAVRLTDKLAYHAREADLEAAVARAFRQRPELLQAELGVRLQREALRAARAGRWPSIDVMFVETYARPDPHSFTTIDWGDAWTAGATVTWPLFDAFATAGRVRQERARLKQKEIGLLDAEERVLLEVRQALLSLEDAEKFVKSQSANLERAREGLRLAEAGYRAGVTTEVAVLDARQALSRTRALYYRAIYNHMMAALLLERATGALAPP